MVIMFPSPSALAGVFASQHPLTRPKSQPTAATPIRREPFPAWSAVDDVKSAGKEASRKAQAKTGQIELYSPKYYAACTFGGLLACVSLIGSFLS